MEQERLTELDFFRGVGIAGMVLMHFFYDLSYFGGINVPLPYGLQLLFSYGHLIFILISGICVTLGTHSFQRGITLLVCGTMISYVTLYGDLVLGLSNIRIWFGILHLLGVSMMLYPLFRDFGAWELGTLGGLFILVGAFLQETAVKVPWFFPLGIRGEAFYAGSDYFPVFPFLGWFLLGAMLGKTVYKDRKSRLPRLGRQSPLLSFFCLLGRNSLAVYLIHQPILVLITLLII